MAWATRGSSRDPGTQATSTASSATPWRRKASLAPERRRSVTKSLNFATTTPKRRPSACRTPRYSVMPLVEPEEVAELVLFDAKVIAVALGGCGDQGHALHGLQPEALQA